MGCGQAPRTKPTNLCNGSASHTQDGRDRSNSSNDAKNNSSSSSTDAQNSNSSNGGNICHPLSIFTPASSVFIVVVFSLLQQQHQHQQQQHQQ
mmetsp:Transcript_32408/g.69422  ORF Transcript_32408/g.69422 Transcript_32408/m.69422 type:complete len:93 (+) Transcript_32408:840-1118(+)